MKFSKLPQIKDVSLPELGIFPNKFYAAVFRLWETCSAERIALALETSTDVINKAAKDMGVRSVRGRRPPNAHRQGAIAECADITIQLHAT